MREYTLIRPDRQSGLSLIELLVAMGVSLVLVSIASYAYLASKNTNRVTDEQTRLYEEARFALEAVGRNIRLAGFAPATEGADKIRYFYSPDGTGLSQSLEPPRYVQQAILGCSGKFDGSTGLCKDGEPVDGPDAIALTFFTDNPALTNNRNFGVGVDCAGQDADVVKVKTRSGAEMMLYGVTNRYYLNTKSYVLDGVDRKLSQLLCMGSGNTKFPQPLFSGVRDMRFVYGVDSDGDQQVDRMLKAEAVTVGALWNQVISVKVCLEMETLRSKTAIASSDYKNCAGETVTAPADTLRRSFSATYNLRNRVSK